MALSDEELAQQIQDTQNKLVSGQQADFGGTLQRALQRELNYNQDIIKQREDANQRIGTLPAQIRAQNNLKDLNVAQKEAIIESAVSRPQQAYNTYNDLLNQRGANVQNVVQSASTGYQNMLQGLQTQLQGLMTQQQRNDQLKQQALDNAYRQQALRQSGNGPTSLETKRQGAYETDLQSTLLGLQQGLYGTQGAREQAINILSGIYPDFAKPGPDGMSDIQRRIYAAYPDNAVEQAVQNYQNSVAQTAISKKSEPSSNQIQFGGVTYQVNSDGSFTPVQ